MVDAREKFTVKSYRIVFTTRHSGGSADTHLSPSIVLYDSASEPAEWSAIVNFWDRLEDVLPAGKNGKTLHLHFHSCWYERILEALRSGEELECEYHVQPTQTWINLLSHRRPI